MTMRITFAATKVAALGAIGAAGVGVPFVASMSGADAGAVRLAALGGPTGPAATAGGWSGQPQDPPPPGQNLPTPDQLSSLCNQVTDPGVSYTTKTGVFLDQGGNWILQHDSAIGLLQAATG